MTDFVDISMLGDKKLQRKLKKIEIQAQRKYVRAGMRKGMTPVKNKAKTLAPIDRGRLRNSIKIRSKSKGGISTVRVTTGTRKDLGIPGYVRWFYPAAIEYGYRKNGRYYPARSFMRKALSDLRHTVIKKTGEHIDSLLQKHGSKK